MNKELEEYFKRDDLACNVWQSKYAIEGEKTPKDMHLRMAKEFARIEGKFQEDSTDEKDSEYYLKTLYFDDLSEYGRNRENLDEEKIFSFFDKFKYIVPQGSIMATLGSDTIASLSNCWVNESPYDSYAGILKSDAELAYYYKRRGGVGQDISNLRPSGTDTNNTAKSTTGAVSFMHRFSNTTREVAMNGRRGALMLSISINHPDVMDFIKVKRDGTSVTGANISVRLNNEFMKAVENGEDYILRFPCESNIGVELQDVYSDPYDELVQRSNYYTKRIKAKEYWNEIVHSAKNYAEPGVLYWDNALDFDPAAVYKEYMPICTNPCFTGDTLIAVGDGRNAVSIKQLAEEGKDVAVYSIDKKTQNVSLKNGVNPRLTGKNKEILRTYLDNGSYIDTTLDHKFLLKDGSVKEACELVKGDSIPTFRKRACPLSKSSPKEYFRVLNGLSEESEHRLIVKYFKNQEFTEAYDKNKKNGWNRGGIVVHHKDYNGLNNSIDNLEIMSFRDHSKYHADKDNEGENNGKWMNVTNEEIENFALELSRSLGRRFSTDEWKNYAKSKNIPKSFSEYRARNWFKTPLELSVWTALILGYEYPEEDPRLLDTLSDMLKQGYEAKIEGNKVLVKKICEYSKEDFWVHHLNRNICFSSKANFLKYSQNSEKYQEKRIKGLNKKQEEKSFALKEEQSRVFSKLKFKLGREPLMKEWEEGCKKENLAYRVGKKMRFGFSNYLEVKEAGNNYNHKVVKTEILEKRQDVYNITVEDNHTVGIVTKVYKNKVGTDCYSGIYTMQCGEQFLNANDSCRLMVLNLFGFVKDPFTDKAEIDYKQLYEVAYEHCRLGDGLVDLELEYIQRIIDKVKSDPEPENIKRGELELWEKSYKNTKAGRRIGLGITALADMIAAINVGYDSEEGLNVVEKVMRTKMLAELDCSIDLAILRGTFEGWDAKKEFQSYNSIPYEGNNKFFQFILDEFPEQAERMAKYGRRNVSLSTIAPAGSTSLLTQTSSGCEPLFMPFYTRRKKINPSDKNAKIDFVDEVGDSWEEFAVLHPKFKEWIEVNFIDVIDDSPTDVSRLSKERLQELFEESPWFKSTANDIDWIKRVEIQSILQRYTTNAISSTINLPNTVTEKQVSDIYMHGWKTGLKGQTIYVDGSRSGVMVSDKKEELVKFHENHAPKRPKKLSAKVVKFNNNYEKWVAFVGLMDGKPYEIFTGKLENVNLPSNVEDGEIVKVYSEEVKRYDFVHKDGTVESISSVFAHDFWNYGKLISGMLRHGMPLNFVVATIQDLDWKEEHINTWKNGIARALKKFIKDGVVEGAKCSDCNSTNIVFEEGCMSCKNCGSSKCG